MVPVDWLVGIDHRRYRRVLVFGKCCRNPCDAEGEPIDDNAH